ncbi:MAG TPA: transglutaminase domain-containing protein [Phycisphaerales bacterium]
MAFFPIQALKLAACAAASLLFVKSAIGQSLTRIELPAGATFAAPIDISRDGQMIVAQLWTDAGPSPFFWTACSGGRVIDHPPGGGLPTNWVAPFAADADGHSVLCTWTPTDNSAPRIFRREVNGSAWKDTGISIPPDSFSRYEGSAWASDDMKAIAFTTSDAEANRAWRWAENGGLHEFAKGNADTADVFGISRDGSVAWGELTRYSRGSPPTGGYTRLVRWTPNNMDVIEDEPEFSPLVGFGWGATSGNLDGSVLVGCVFPVRVPYEPGYAARWGPGGRQILGVLPGTTNSWALGVDGSGNRVVGECLIVDPLNPSVLEPLYAFVWTPQNGMRSLESLLTEEGVNLAGWELRSANVISLDGSAIAGWGYYQGVKTLYLARLPQLIRKVDALVDYNAVRHETEGYKPKVVDAQVVRRDRLVEMDVEVFTPFEVSASSLKFEVTHRFDRAPNSAPDSDPVETKITVPFYSDTVPPTQWGFTVLRERVGPINSNDAGMRPVKTVTVGFYAPKNAPVGEYIVRAIAKVGEVEESRRLDCNVIFLFNPLSGGDPAMPERLNRDEYLHLTRGAIPTNKSPYKWEYAQFSREVLRGTMELLSNASSETRTSSAMTARHISAYGNSSSSTRGLLTGDWEKQPADIVAGEVHPTAWSGSVPIFSRYAESGAVKYGQCWVFAGTLTSACRTLGIPSRPVTNIVSGHDEPPYDFKIPLCWEKYHDVKLNRDLWQLSGDVWNFHVWVEAWLNGGWSAIDSTPQETSDGLYQLGPAPVQAVKARSLNTPFDVPFVVAEVDADVWVEPGDDVTGPTIPRQPNVPCVVPANPAFNTTFVGQGVLTKSKGSNLIEDITIAYKTPEVVAPAPIMQPPAARIVVPAKIELGANFAGEIVVTNSADTNEDFVVRHVLTAATYTRRLVGILGEPTDVVVSLLPGGTTSVPLSCPWSSFKSHYPGGDHINISAVVTRVSTGEIWGLTSSTPVFDLPITVASPAPSSVPVGTLFDATVSVTNLLDNALVNCVIKISGDVVTPIDGTRESDEVSVGTLNPGQSVAVTRSFKAIREGYSGVSAWFSAEGLRTSSNGISVNVNRCAGDLTEDTIIDDEDFQRFVIAYNILDCDSRQMDVRCLGDLNADGIVDDLDFQLFVVAYDQLVCP